MEKSDICLVVVFNHRYDANLPKLRKLYSGRFDHVHFLMPFYQGNDDDVTTVFDSSSRFQGYYAQALRDYKREGATHYVFIADDLLLDPTLNQENLLEAFRVGPQEGYIKELLPVSEESFDWPFLMMALKACRFDNFVNARQELPSRDDALARFARFGLSTAPLGKRNLPRLEREKFAWSLRTWLLAAQLVYAEKGGVRNIVYPLARSYSDLAIIPAHAIDAFCHYCGVFAAMGVFVECAIPTAMILCLDNIRLESELSRQGVEMFHRPDEAAFEEKHGRKLTGLLEGKLPNDSLYIHPVKLSRWQTEG